MKNKLDGKGGNRETTWEAMEMKQGGTYLSGLNKMWQ